MSSIIQKISNLDSIVENCIWQYDVPGLSLAIIKDGEIIFSQGYGTRTLHQVEAVDGQTLFAIASMSKSTVALSLAMLAEEDKIKWDDRVTNYLPGFQLYDAFASCEMTLRDLMIHNSGLPEVAGGTIWYGSDYSREEVIARLRYLKPNHSFRSHFAYQNIFYLVGGQVIQAVTGRSWDDFVQERIFDPLRMNRSNTKLSRLAGLSNVASPHRLVNGEVKVIPYRNHDNVGPAASINSSAEDLGRYLLFFLSGGECEGQLLLKPESIKTLLTPNISIPIPETPEILNRLAPHFYAYGLGWFMQDYCGKKMVFHSGGVDGMRGRMTMLPEEKLGVVVLTNQEERDTYLAITLTILDAFLEQFPFNWTDKMLRVRNENLEKEKAAQKRIEDGLIFGTKLSLPILDYVGVYRDRMIGDLEIACEGDHLVLRFCHTPAFTADLKHWHYDTFRLAWRDPEIPDGFITFSLNAQGKVSRFEFDQPALLDVDFKEVDFYRV